MSLDGVRLQPRAVILKLQQGPWLPDSLWPAPLAVHSLILLRGLEKRRLMPPQPWPPCLVDFMRSDLQSHFRTALGYRGCWRSDSAVIRSDRHAVNLRWNWRSPFIGWASVLHLGSWLFIWDLSSLTTSKPHNPESTITSSRKHGCTISTSKLCKS